MGEPDKPLGFHTRVDAGTEVAVKVKGDPKHTDAGEGVIVITGLGFTFTVTVAVCVQLNVFVAVTV